jgi:nitrogen fixation protein FixH
MKVLLTGVAIAGLLAVAGSIIIGIRSFDGPVTEHPYKRGLQWDSIQQKRESLGWHVIINNDVLYTGINELSFSLLDRNGSPLDGKDIGIEITRPSSSRHDAEVAAEDRGNRYRAVINFPLYGYWDMSFTVKTENEEVAITKRVFVKKGGGK